MKNTKKLMAAFMASTMMVTGLAGCSSGDKENAEETTGHTRTEAQYKGSFNVSEAPSAAYDEDAMNEAYLNYAISLFAQTLGSATEDENIMISPASIALAMEMTGAGACDDTLRQITDLISADATPEEVQAFMADLNEHLNNAEALELHSANSMWANEDILGGKISDEYLEFIREYYEAEGQEIEFDQSAVDIINDWIEEKTNGMIPDMISELGPDTVMVLVNAIAFEAQWFEPYEEYQVNENGEFTNSDGEVQTVTMLNDTLSGYFSTEFATGFKRYYTGGDYYFLAMLPTDESVNINEFAAGLTGDMYREFIDSYAASADVYTRLPEFGYDYSVVLNDILRAMGVEDGFTDNANFGNITEEEMLYISKVLHNTHIEVDRNGTRAAAATAVMLDTLGISIAENEAVTIYLDRPFVYAIVDASTDIPVFIGTVNEI